MGEELKGVHRKIGARCEKAYCYWGTTSLVAVTVFPEKYFSPN